MLLNRNNLIGMLFNRNGLFDRNAWYVEEKERAVHFIESWGTETTKLYFDASA